MSMEKFKWPGAVGAAAVLCIIAAPVSAQETAAGPQVFAADFFDSYNPVTAADMVAQVPGFVLEQGDDRRGFGATAGNLLINGERPSSKTAPAELLQRIPADNVIRIELLSGTDSSSGVRGQSQLVNVIVRQTAGQAAATTYTLGLRHVEYSNRIAPLVQISRTMTLSPSATLSLNVSAPNTFGRGESVAFTRTPSGVLLSERIQYGDIDRLVAQGSAALNWRPGPNDTLNFNLQVAPAWVENLSSYRDFNAAGDLQGTLSGVSENSNNYTGELGADWEHRFSPAFSLKTIGLISTSSSDQHDEFNTFSIPATMNTRIQDRSTQAGERVGRLQARWTVSDAHSLEFGAEGAFNFRETSLSIAAGPTGGPLTPVPLAIANARVEEVRGEAFITDVWKVSQQLTVETGLAYEVSTITQTGDQTQERSFSYAKPRLAATYVWSPARTLRFVFNRDVSQLDFSEFSSAVDFVNTSTTRGNPNLLPEQAWQSRLELENRFGERGALTLAVFHDRVEHVRDFVVIGGVDAYGNIGDGTRTGVEVRASTDLAALGAPNIELRFNGVAQKTEVTDPITGQSRSFAIDSERSGSAPSTASLNAGAKDWAYVFNFRQDLPQIRSSWGIAVAQWSGRQTYRRTETYTYDRPLPRVDVYYETTRFEGLTLRLFVNNILSPSEDQVRTFYQGDRGAGIVDRVEYRLNAGGPEGTFSYGFQVSGRF